MPSLNGLLLAATLVALVASAGEPEPQGQEQQPQPPAVTGPADATALFAALAKIEGLEARYSEEKHLALLAAPLTSRGHLYYMRPGYLARLVEEPERSTLTISPNELRMSGKEGLQTIDLRQNDNVRTFVTSLVRIFSGDEAALRQSYDITFVTDAASWTLTLTPRDKPLTSMMRDLVLHGAGLGLTSIVVREPNGDRTVTRIEAADTARRFTDAEKSELFGIQQH